MAGSIANLSVSQLPQHNKHLNWMTPRPAGSAGYLQWTNEMVEAQRTGFREQVQGQMHIEGKGSVYDEHVT